MPEGKKKKKGWKNGRYRNYRYNDPNLWRPGQPLTEDDQKMLESVRLRYKQLGYTPSKREVANASVLKKRFRTWADVILAAGLPEYNDIGQIRIRESKKKVEEPEKWDLFHF